MPLGTLGPTEPHHDAHNHHSTAQAGAAAGQRPSPNPPHASAAPARLRASMCVQGRPRPGALASAHKFSSRTWVYCDAGGASIAALRHTLQRCFALLQCCGKRVLLHT